MCTNPSDICTANSFTAVQYQFQRCTNNPQMLYTQQLAIFKPRLSYFRLLKAQLNRSCLNLICYILWYASNKKCTERFEPWYKKVVPLFNDTNNGTRYCTFCTGTRTAVQTLHTQVHLERRKYISATRSF